MKSEIDQSSEREGSEGSPGESAGSGAVHGDHPSRNDLMASAAAKLAKAARRIDELDKKIQALAW